MWYGTGGWEEEGNIADFESEWSEEINSKDDAFIEAPVETEVVLETSELTAEKEIFQDSAAYVLGSPPSQPIWENVNEQIDFGSVAVVTEMNYPSDAGQFSMQVSTGASQTSGNPFPTMTSLTVDSINTLFGFQVAWLITQDEIGITEAHLENKTIVSDENETTSEVEPTLVVTGTDSTEACEDAEKEKSESMTEELDEVNTESLN